MTAEFLVIPAIDIKGGRCVRLRQGRMEEETVFSEFPVEMAQRWEEEGAGLLHVVDLDGAVSGEPVNKDTIADITDTVQIPVQVGGGIRDEESTRWYLDSGVDRVILGTAAIEGDLLGKMSRSYPGRIILGLDIKEGNVAVSGWVNTIDLTPLKLVKRAEILGVGRIVYTSVARDGTLSGPDIKGLEDLARDTDLGVISSGGIGSIEDIIAVSRLQALGVEGVIVGMALYRGKFTLREAMARLSAKER